MRRIFKCWASGFRSLPARSLLIVSGLASSQVPFVI